MSNKLPDGYFIIDGLYEAHDGDVVDGRYGLYHGAPGTTDSEFLGNLHDKRRVIDMAWIHSEIAKI